MYRYSRARSAYLFAVSLFFYYKTSGIFILLLMFTIVSDFLWGRAIHKTKSQALKRIFLTCSILLNLFLLAYFKYSYFFHDSLNQILGLRQPFFNHFAAFANDFFSAGFSVDKLILPVGLSFFTFQSLSYTIDVYRNRVAPVTNVLDYGFFVCFFPHLVAGPIVKAHDFLYQIYQPYQLSKRDFGMALFWITNGFCKKIIADYLAVNYIDRVFENPMLYSGIEIIVGIFGYSLQIYMDFSGYTDMAIGLALVLGYRLKMNFDSPYKATSTSEFWKRWHISLSSWLKEYLYIPLGGNRQGTVGSYLCIVIIVVFMILLSGKLWLLAVMAGLALLFSAIGFFSRTFRSALNTNINLMVTMLLGGLWHGSSWLFLIWGGLNGLGLILHKLWSRVSPFKGEESRPVRFLLMLITLTFISYTRIYFRSPDLETVSAIYYQIWAQPAFYLLGDLLVKYAPVMLLLGLGYIVHWLPHTWKENYRGWFADSPYPVMGLLMIAAVFLMYQLMSGEMQPFIYFQF